MLLGAFLLLPIPSLPCCHIVGLLICHSLCQLKALSGFCSHLFFGILLWCYSQMAAPFSWGPLAVKKVGLTKVTLWETISVWCVCVHKFCVASPHKNIQSNVAKSGYYELVFSKCSLQIFTVLCCFCSLSFVVGILLMCLSDLMTECEIDINTFSVSFLHRYKFPHIQELWCPTSPYLMEQGKQISRPPWPLLSKRSLVWDSFCTFTTIIVLYYFHPTRSSVLFALSFLPTQRWQWVVISQ